MADIKGLYSGILTSLHRESPHKTMAKKLIINVAPTGSFTNREQNPGQPYTMEENVKAVVEALAKRAVKRFVALVNEIARDETPDDASTLIRRSVETVCDFIDANPGAVALCLSGDPKSGPGHELNEPLVGISAYLVEYAVPGVPSAEVAIVSRTAMSIVLGILRSYLSAGDDKPYVRQELIYVLTSWLYCRFPPAEDRAWSDPAFPIRPSAPSSDATATRTPVYPAYLAPTAD